jgi:phage-related protein
LYTLKIENSNGEIFELTRNSANYYVIGIQGLTRPATAVNTSTGGTVDGAFYNSSRVEQRNIVITVVINGDIETNRQRLYDIFPMKTKCTIYFTNANRNVKIDGYVEVLDGDLFVQREQIQISIICPRPYFEDLETIYTELSQIVRKFQFPFAIDEPIPFSEIVDYPLCTIHNGGDTSCGCIMTVTFTGSVTGFTIYHSTTQTFVGFNYSFAAGDTLTINTNTGQLSAILTRSGQNSNIINYLSAGSTWFKLLPGDNNFTYATTTGGDAVRVEFATTNLYGGV